MSTVARQIGDMARLFQGRVPGQLIIQLTDRCNAKCPQCGMRVTNNFQRSRLQTDRVKAMLDNGAKQGFSMVSFTGGEPFLFFDDLVELIDYAGRAGFIYIRTGTNGYLFRRFQDPTFSYRINRLAERLAATPLRNLWISIDSAVPEIHERMRGFPGVLQGIEQAVNIFHQHGIYPSANLGLNRNITEQTPDAELGGEPDFYETFYQGMKRMYRRLIDLGFTLASACYPMSIDSADETSGLDSVYGATASARLVSFSPEEKIEMYRALAAVIPQFRPHLRIVTPLSSLHSLRQQYAGQSWQPYSCRGGKEYFFVDCRDGQTYPCGYRGQEALGDFAEIDCHRQRRKTHCVACDWECFRDPSELFGPLVEGFTRPLQLWQRKQHDPEFLRLWAEDVRYARACHFFNGRTPFSSQGQRDWPGEPLEEIG